MKALVDVVLAVARLAAACGDRLVELDLNPVVVRRRGAVAVDSLVVDGGARTMELELSDDQQALQESVRAVLERECPISLVRSVVEEHKHAEELWSRMVELDWPALAVPEDDGGLGLGFVELAVVCEELGRVAVPGAVPGHRHAVRPRPGGGRGPPSSGSRFLGAVARDGIVGTLAVAEAAGIFDAGRHHDHGRARRRRLRRSTARSTSSSTPSSPTRSWWRPAWRAAPATTASACSSSPGRRCDAEPMVDLDASRQLRHRRPRRRAGRAPSASSGQPGESGPALRRAIEEATVALAAEMVGTCQAIFDIVHAYVQEREQFGVKIGSFQAIKHKLANMYVAVESARATAYFAARGHRRVRRAPRHGRGHGQGERRVTARSSCTTEGIQCLGGIGYTWEHDMHLYVKRAKSGAALFGTGARAPRTPVTPARPVSSCRSLSCGAGAWTASLRDVGLSGGTVITVAPAGSAKSRAGGDDEKRRQLEGAPRRRRVGRGCPSR